MIKPPRILLRIVSACLVPALLFGLGFLGCTGGGGPGDTRDPAAYALDVKTEVTGKLHAARQNRDNAALNVSLLVSFLEDYQNQPVGEHEPIYADLLAGCQQIKQMYDRSAPAGQINAKIEEMIALAGKLPGQIEVDEE